ncbi:uncharacterized protein LOC121693601 [Alosa sapidissima]|uniref:uncharacterized protein LOC121693601 n=1 Tax=Alosa sapidissima TaxID=34773 RepID=UPI001C08ABF8|nr:uncharacterized protein LOC121693601 [Alosa sapidissima]
MAAGYLTNIMILLLLFFDSTHGNSKVTQLPPAAIQVQESSITLTCSHNDTSLSTILWYKHSQNTGLKLLGYLTITTQNLEPEFKDGSAFGDEVKQFLTVVFKNRNESETLPCLHTYSSYYYILWYKQSQDGEMKFLGNIGTSANVESEFLTSKKITMKGNGAAKSYANLTINRLEESDSAVYYCAASEHSATTQPSLSHLSLFTHYPASLTRLTETRKSHNFHLLQSKSRRAQ